MPRAPAAALRRPVPDPDYAGRRGYDPRFLGRASVPLPTLSPAQRRQAARPAGRQRRDAALLHYHHFSLVMHAARRLPFFTAANVDGARRPPLPPRTDRWVSDPRLPAEAQIRPAFYAGNDFDLGHLVRRLDPAWGDTPAEARRANDDTFHLTNCAPQHQDFNRSAKIWAGLEDYLLDRARARGFRACIFTGPVLAEDDPVFAGVAVPLRFWKVVAALTGEGRLSATAYLVSQVEQVAAMNLRAAPFGPFRTCQVRVREIGALTGLGFGRLAACDPLMRRRGPQGIRVPLEDFGQIIV
jgi:endonuclease G